MRRQDSGRQESAFKCIWQQHVSFSLMHVTEHGIGNVQPLYLFFSSERRSDSFARFIVKESGTRRRSRRLEAKVWVAFSLVQTHTESAGTESISCLSAPSPVFLVVRRRRKAAPERSLTDPCSLSALSVFEQQEYSVAEGEDE